MDGYIIWQMAFNTKKCHVMSAHRGKPKKVHEYCMGGTPLTAVEHHTYLGVELSHNMSWTEHTNKIKNKATRVLNLARRNFSRGTSVNSRNTIYKAIVRPHLEYCSTVWDPANRKDIEKLESVQNKAARFVMQRHRRTESVTEMKRSLEWQTLQERRFVSRQKVFYKTIHDKHALKVPPYIAQPAVQLRRHHSYTYNVVRSNVNAYRLAFFPRTIRVWNLLPSYIVCATSIESFTDLLNKAIQNGSVVIVFPKTVQYAHSSPLAVPTAGQPVYVY